MSDAEDFVAQEPTGEAVERDEVFPEQDSVEAPERRQLTVRGAAIASARAVTGLIGVGVAAAVIAAAGLLPFPTVRATPPSVVVNPVPTAQQLVCPGAVLRLADESGQDATTSSPLGRPSVRFAASAGEVDASPLAESDAGTGGTPEAPTLISTPPSATGDTEPALLSGSQVQELSEGDFVGLAAADCGVATGETWLVGGSTTVGRTTLLTLSNPTEVPATVDIELFGDTGAIAAPGTSGIIVAPQGQRVLSLAGFQPDVAAPVVHVTSTGGHVVANLQQTVVRGLAPGGIDILAGSAASTENVIPGVMITNAAAVQALLGGGDGYQDVTTTLRLFAPGDDTVPVTVSVMAEDGAVTGLSFAVDIEGGRVTDVPIQELATGRYTVSIESDAPVVAAVRVTSAVGQSTDFAWAAAAAPLQDRAQVTVAPGPSPLLHLANPTGSEAVVTVGAEQVTVPAGGATAVPVTSGATLELSGFERLFAAVTFTEGGAIAHYTVHPPGVASGPVTVYR